MKGEILWIFPFCIWCTLLIPPRPCFRLRNLLRSIGTRYWGTVKKIFAWCRMRTPLRYTWMISGIYARRSWNTTSFSLFHWVSFSSVSSACAVRIDRQAPNIFSTLCDIRYNIVAVFNCFAFPAYPDKMKDSEIAALSLTVAGFAFAIGQSIWKMFKKLGCCEPKFTLKNCIWSSMKSYVPRVPFLALMETSFSQPTSHPLHLCLTAWQ